MIKVTTNDTKHTISIAVEIPTIVQVGKCESVTFSFEHSENVEYNMYHSACFGVLGQPIHRE
jgi:hypothetical protein